MQYGGLWLPSAALSPRARYDGYGEVDVGIGDPGDHLARSSRRQRFERDKGNVWRTVTQDAFGDHRSACVTYEPDGIFPLGRAQRAQAHGVRLGPQTPGWARRPRSSTPTGSPRSGCTMGSAASPRRSGRTAPRRRPRSPAPRTAARKATGGTLKVTTQDSNGPSDHHHARRPGAAAQDGDDLRRHGDLRSNGVQVGTHAGAGHAVRPLRQADPRDRAVDGRRFAARQIRRRLCVRRRRPRHEPHGAVGPRHDLRLREQRHHGKARLAGPHVDPGGRAGQGRPGPRQDRRPDRDDVRALRRGLGGHPPPDGDHVHHPRRLRPHGLRARPGSRRDLHELRRLRRGAHRRRRRRAALRVRLRHPRACPPARRRGERRDGVHRLELRHRRARHRPPRRRDEPRRGTSTATPTIRSRDRRRTR